jgi:hypothetical protein
MVADFAITKQFCQQGQGVLGKGRINERFLPFQGGSSATARFSVIVEIRVHYFRK